MTIAKFADISEETIALWEAGGFPPGASTGWPSLDEFYTVGMSQWTLVTGTPNSGKSEWLDALMVNLAKRGAWKFLIYSPENHPLAWHQSKLIEKIVGKPFNPGRNERVSKDEVVKAQAWMMGKFHFCKPKIPDICAILEEAGAEISSVGDNWKTGVVVDPWNQLEHCRPAKWTETEYVSHALSAVLERVRMYRCHLWLVAHPTKMQNNERGKQPVATPRDVSGSAHFWNKADNCVSVYRDQGAGDQTVQIHVQKVRWKHIGHIGMTELLYDRVTGRYAEKRMRVVQDSDNYRNAHDGT